MSFLDKFLNPLKGKKTGAYQDISKDSKQVTPNYPSKLLLYSRDIAGMQIQKNMSILNDCRWIRADYTYPSFDSMVFIYKNKVFSVIIDIQDENGTSYLPELFVQRQLYASKEHNLIPCKFPVVINDVEEPDLEKVRAKTGGWNLYNTKTDEEIIPEHLATTEKIEMSEWEIRNYTVMFVMRYLVSQNMKIHSYQDTLEVDPQIWFETPDGKKCWMTVRHCISPEKEIKKPDKLKEIIRRCFQYDGYFAGIILTPMNEDENDKKLYRGGGVKVEFPGIEKLHSSL